MASQAAEQPTRSETRPGPQPQRSTIHAKTVGDAALTTSTGVAMTPSTVAYPLAAELCLDKSTASRVVATLQRKGYVGRVTHPGDGRAVLLDVTPAGRRLGDRIRADRVAERTVLLAAFSPEVREGITDVMRRLADATRRRMTPAASSTPRSA